MSAFLILTEQEYVENQLLISGLDRYNQLGQTEFWITAISTLVIASTFPDAPNKCLEWNQLTHISSIRNEQSF